MIAVLALGGVMAWLTAGFVIYALWTPEWLKEGDNLAWAAAEAAFWPLLVPYLERRPKEKNRGRNRQAEADHRNSGSATDTNDPTGGRARASASAGAHSGVTNPNNPAHVGVEWKMTSPIYSTPPKFTFTPSDIPQVEPKPPLERVKQSMPIMATRWARIVLTPDGPRFKSVTDYGDVFEVDADAKCAKSPLDIASAVFRAMDAQKSGRPSKRPTKHDAPDPDCKCGFYAVPSDKLPKHKSYGGLQLLVELSGTVIEHEEGYRSGHQRVLEATIPRCAGCGETAARAWLNPDASDHAPLWDCGEHEIVSGVCTLMAVTVDQLAKSLGVSFV